MRRSTWFRRPGSIFFRVSKQGPCFTAIEEDGGDKRSVQLELACEADAVAQTDPGGFTSYFIGHLCLRIYSEMGGGGVFR